MVFGADPGADFDEFSGHSIITSRTAARTEFVVGQICLLPIIGMAVSQVDTILAISLLKVGSM